MIPSASDEGAQGADLRRSRRPQRRIVPVTVDRLPPNSPEAECGTLGCCLMDPRECVPEAIERLKAEGEEFYDLRHTTIWTAMVEMFEKNLEIDVITLQQYLKDQDLLAQVGGLPYLAALPDSVPSSANLSYYLDIVCEKYVLRKMIQTCTEAVGRVYDYEGEVDTLMDEVERDLIRIREVRSAETIEPTRELVKQAIQTIEDAYQNRGMVSGLSTGFTDLDRMTGGLKAPDVIVIAARPSMGKTSLAMNIAENIAVDQKLPVGIFSLEMSAPSLVLRMLCSRARVNLRNIADGFLGERDFPKLTGAAGKIADAPIYIDDSSALSIMQIRAKARRMVSRWGIKALVLDYLQLATSTNRKARSRQEEIADISAGMKSIAKDLGIPVIVLSQLNRELERDKNRKPRMSDLRESGAIEQDADIIGLLYRAFRDDDDDGVSWENQEAWPVNLLIGKNRNGPTGDVNLTFLRSYTRFENAARVSDEDVPTQRQFEV